MVSVRVTVKVRVTNSFMFRARFRIWVLGLWLVLGLVLDYN